MSIEIKVPQLPESVSDATLVAWHKKAGEAVARDKVVLEVPAPASGVLQEIRVEQGSTVNAGDVLALLEEGATATAGGGQAAKQTGQEQEPQQAPAATKKAAPKERSGPIKTSPAVRRLLDEYDLDETMVVGTGKDGRQAGEET